MRSIRNWILCVAFCLIPGLAKACDGGHVYSKTVHISPGPAQEIRISQKPVSDGCEYDFEVKQSNHVILRFPLVTGNKNAPPPSSHVTGQSGNAIEYRVSFVKIPALHDSLKEILIYYWVAGGDSGTISTFVYGFVDGAIRQLLSLSESDGTLSVHVANGRLHIRGQMTNSCMACGKSTKMSLRWSRRLGGFVLVRPEGRKFAKYLNYNLPGNGVDFDYGKVDDQYDAASAHLRKIYYNFYDRADEAQRKSIRGSEIAWIEKKRRTCGHQGEALQLGHLAIAECLINETSNQIEYLEDQFAKPTHIAGVTSDNGTAGKSGTATAATLRKCRNPLIITMNQLLVSRLLANRKGYYVTAITSEPYPSLSSGDVNGEHDRNVYCGFRDIYKYSKNPVAMGIQETYSWISYDRFHVITREKKLGGVHLVQPGALQELKDAWDLLNQ